MYPDLFYKAQPTVGPPGVGIWVPPADPTGGADSNTFPMLPSFRNLPIVMWNMHTDELVPFAGTEYQAHQGFDALGLRYEFWVFAPGEHLTLAINDQFQPMADWLGIGQVDRNPAHVTYVVNPHMAFPNIGIEVDHAYWLSGLALRDGSGTNPLGTIDVRSEAFGTGDPTPGGTQVDAGVLTGGTIPAIGYERQRQEWGAVPATPVADKLDIKATNVKAVTVDVARARVDCNVQLNVQTDGVLAVNIPGCGAPRIFQPTAAASQLPSTRTARPTVMLAALGMALLMFAAVASATARWRGGQIPR